MHLEVSINPETYSPFFIGAENDWQNTGLIPFLLVHNSAELKIQWNLNILFYSFKKVFSFGKIK